MNNKTRIIVTSGLFVAIYAVFFLVSINVGGFLESTLFFLLPIPLAIFTYKYSIKYAFIPYISISLIGYFINPISTLFYVLTANILGIIYGEMLRKNINFKLRLLICILATLVVDILTMIVFANLLNYSLHEEIFEIFRVLLKIIRIDINTFKYGEKLVYISMPIFIGLMAIIEGLAIHLGIVFTMNRLKLINESLGSIYFIKYPKWIAILYTISLILHISTAYFYYTSDGFLMVLAAIICVIFWILAVLLFMKGYLNLVIKFNMKKWTKYLSILLIVSILLIPVLAIFIISILGNISVFSEK